MSARFYLQKVCNHLKVGKDCFLGCRGLFDKVACDRFAILSSNLIAFESKELCYMEKDNVFINFILRSQYIEQQLFLKVRYHMAFLMEL